MQTLAMQRDGDRQPGPLLESHAAPSADGCLHVPLKQSAPLVQNVRTPEIVPHAGFETVATAAVAHLLLLLQ